MVTAWEGKGEEGTGVPEGSVPFPSVFRALGRCFEGPVGSQFWWASDPSRTLWSSLTCSSQESVLLQEGPPWAPAALSHRQGASRTQSLGPHVLGSERSVWSVSQLRCIAQGTRVGHRSWSPLTAPLPHHTHLLLPTGRGTSREEVRGTRPPQGSGRPRTTSARCRLLPLFSGLPLLSAEVGWRTLRCDPHLCVQ